MDSSDISQQTENSSLHLNTSTSQTSHDSQTAQDYIAAQLRLEADAREALPYQFDTCTKPLGPLRQSVFACLTCTPPPASPHQQFTPAAVCYSCSISCHGEHDLIELFSKRDFVCDCGTTRLANSGTPCSLRVNVETGRKGGVTGEEARLGNKYNQNFQGKFCGCGEEYDAEKEKGTMFQCLGLGTVDNGGCGEDWWHPECLLGLSRSKPKGKEEPRTQGVLDAVKEAPEVASELPSTSGNVNGEPEDVEEETPLPAGFPDEDDFDHLICYKCAEAFPWIKQYAGAPGWLPAIAADGTRRQVNSYFSKSRAAASSKSSESKKRRAEDDPEDAQHSKKARADAAPPNQPADNTTQTSDQPAPKHTTLQPAPEVPCTLFLNSDFRDHLCRCPACFPRLAQHPQLLEEEDSYEPPLSESSSPLQNGNGVEGADDARSVNSRGSLLSRGEAALSAMDRVQAIEGVRAYNHVRDKVKAFLQPFAESGQQVSSQDVLDYFAGLRERELAAREAAMGMGGGGRGSGDGNYRREQGGY